MRNYDPKDKYDKEEAKRIGAQKWHLELLGMNPEYTSWGPHEDYMVGKNSGWDSNQFFTSWADFRGSFGKLDDLNELVNFYFAIDRESVECPDCGGNGYHPKAQKVVNSFYSHMNPLGEHWNDKITEDEAAALVKAGRGKKGMTAKDFNDAERGRGLGHDCINRGILTEARLKRLGLPVTCTKCEGHGHVFTTSEAHVELVLWMLHPRKGAARGIEIKNIKQDNLQDVFDFLRAARDRNHFRFSKIPTSATIK